MSFTEDEAITEVRFLINEESADFWSDTELRSWIQQGVLQISTKLLSAEVSQDLTLVTDQWEYDDSDETWLSTLLKTKDAYYIASDGDTTGLQRIELNMVGHTMHFQTSGTPRYFSETDRKFYIWPRPSSEQNGDTIRVVHAKVTDAIADLRDEHQQMSFNFAAARAKMKDRQFQESALYMSEFVNSINFERQDKYDMGAEKTQELDVP